MSISGNAKKFIRIVKNIAVADAVYFETPNFCHIYLKDI